MGGPVVVDVQSEYMPFGFCPFTDDLNCKKNDCDEWDDKYLCCSEYGVLVEIYDDNAVVRSIIDWDDIGCQMFSFHNGKNKGVK
jgi:hypothetical protein